MDTRHTYVMYARAPPPQEMILGWPKVWVSHVSAWAGWWRIGQYTILAQTVHSSLQTKQQTNSWLTTNFALSNQKLFSETTREK